MEAKSFFQNFSIDNILEGLDNKTAEAALDQLLQSLPDGIAHIDEGELKQSALKGKTTQKEKLKGKDGKRKDNVIDFSAYQKKR